MEYGNALTMASLFDGIGGFLLVAVRNGITPVWASEIEPLRGEPLPGLSVAGARAGLAAKLDGSLLPPVDIICGGSPCQDSVLPARAAVWAQRVPAFSDTRSGS